LVTGGLRGAFRIGRHTIIQAAEGGLSGLNFGE